MNSIHHVNLPEGVRSGFLIKGDFLDAIPYGSGHINDTFLVRYIYKGRASQFIFQRINHHVFKNPAGLMDNIKRTCVHLQNKAIALGKDPVRYSLAVVPAREGNLNYFLDGADYWRAYPFIGQSFSVDVVENEEQAYQAARTFGKFTTLLDDLPGDRLEESIPDFHHTVKRYNRFEEVIEADSKGRLSSCESVVKAYLSERALANYVVEGLSNGLIKERVTHNDTKISNVLLDKKTGRGICVVDLDTIMPGSLLYDLSDLVRTSTGMFEENERDLSKISMNLSYFRAVMQGFLEQTVSIMSEAEIAFLPRVGQLLTFECGMRFLTDYLEGDVYFRIHDEDENLVRAKTQLKFLQIQQELEPELQQIVKETLKQIH